MTREEILQRVAELPEDELARFEALLEQFPCSGDRPRRRLPESVGAGRSRERTDIARYPDRYLEGLGQ